MFTDEFTDETETTSIINKIVPEAHAEDDFMAGFDDEYLVEQYCDGTEPSATLAQFLPDQKAELKAAVDKCEAKGFPVVNAPPAYDHKRGAIWHTKGPRTTDWPDNPPSHDEVRARLVGFAHGHPENLNLVLGEKAGNLIGIDKDSPQASRAWRVISKAKAFSTRMVRLRKSSPETGHEYYVVDAPVRSMQFAHPAMGEVAEASEKSMHIEILAKGRSASIPPSVHPDTDERFYWQDGCMEPGHAKAADLVYAVRMTAVAAMMARNWPSLEGAHYHTMAAFAGVLARGGVTEENALLLTRAMVAAYDDKKLEKRLASVRSTYQTHQKSMEDSAKGVSADSIVHVTGVPRLVEFVGEKVASCICNWLELQIQKDEPATTTSPTSPAADWQPCDVAEMLRVPPPALDWLFEGTIVRGITAGLTGTGGAGKSTLALQVGLSAAVGRAFLPLFKPVKPLIVMAFLGEDPELVTRQRMYAIGKWARLTDAEFKLFVQNFKLYPYVAEPLLSLVDGKMSPTARYKWMVAEVGRIKPDFIILDPKSRWYAGDENSNDHATQFVNQLDALIRPCNATILVTHHVGKGKGETGPYSARGASSFPDSARWFAHLGRATGNQHPNPADTENNYLTFQVTKSNYSPITPHPVILRQLISKGGVIEQYEGPASKMSDVVNAMATALEALGPINRSAIGDSSKGGKEFAEAVLAKVDCTANDRLKALAWGLENGVFYQQEDSSGKGRKAIKIGVILQKDVDDGDDANPVAFLDDLDEEVPYEPEFDADTDSKNAVPLTFE